MKKESWPPNISLTPTCQVDYLQQANRDLEKRLKDTLNKQIEAAQCASELEEKNAKLLLDVKDIDRMTRKLEDEKERNANAARSELAQTQVS